MNTRQIIEKIQSASEITELAQVTTFEGYLEGAGLVEVTIRDRGEGEQYRYNVFARTKDLDVQKTATGNPERELDTAIATTHWYQLKR